MNQERFQKNPRLNKKGFSLVELMTVVAIIGGLAALGVPQYRKLQRKAKRAEANMLLGMIGSAEAAFLGEYNAWTTNLGAIGLELERLPQHYRVGFTGVGIQIQFPSSAGGAFGGGPFAPAPNQLASFPQWGAATLRIGNVEGAARVNLEPTLVGGVSLASNARNGIFNLGSYTVTATARFVGAVRDDQLDMNHQRVITLVQDMN